MISTYILNVIILSLIIMPLSSNCNLSAQDHSWLTHARVFLSSERGRMCAGGLIAGSFVAATYCAIKSRNFQQSLIDDLQERIKTKDRERDECTKKQKEQEEWRKKFDEQKQQHEAKQLKAEAHFDTLKQQQEEQLRQDSYTIAGLRYQITEQKALIESRDQIINKIKNDADNAMQERGFLPERLSPDCDTIPRNMLPKQLSQLVLQARNKNVDKICKDNGIERSGSIFLFGPVKTGKRAIAKALAHHLNAYFAHVGITSKASTLESIKQIFTLAEQWVKKHPKRKLVVTLEGAELALSMTGWGAWAECAERFIAEFTNKYPQVIFVVTVNNIPDLKDHPLRESFKQSFDVIIQTDYLSSKQQSELLDFYLSRKGACDDAVSDVIGDYVFECDDMQKSQSSHAKILWSMLNPYVGSVAASNKKKEEKKDGDMAVNTILGYMNAERQGALKKGLRGIVAYDCYEDAYNDERKQACIQSIIQELRKRKFKVTPGLLKQIVDEVVRDAAHQGKTTITSQQLLAHVEHYPHQYNAQQEALDSMLV